MPPLKNTPALPKVIGFGWVFAGESVPCLLQISDPGRIFSKGAGQKALECVPLKGNPPQKITPPMEYSQVGFRQKGSLIAMSHPFGEDGKSSKRFCVVYSIS